MRYFPYFIGQFIELVVSMKRIQDFMVCDTLNTTIIHQLDVNYHHLIILQPEEGNENAIVIKDGNFHWGISKEITKIIPKKEDKTDIIEEENLDESIIDKKDAKETQKITLDSIIALKNVNLNIKHREFVCVIGDVGSGKSSLLSAMIGDMLYLD